VVDVMTDPLPQRQHRAGAFRGSNHLDGLARPDLVDQLLESNRLSVVIEGKRRLLAIHPK
jgi:hypothetical protein